MPRPSRSAVIDSRYILSVAFPGHVVKFEPGNEANGHIDSKYSGVGAVAAVAALAATLFA